MARGRKGTGVQLRDHDIRVRFTWNGKRYELPLQLEPTIANKKRCERMMVEVQRAIALGSFAFKDFPDLPTPAGVELAKLVTFGEYGQRWRDARSELSEAQQDKDRLAVTFWARHVGGLDVDPAKIVPSELEANAGKALKGKGASYRNNQVSALRGILGMWAKDDPRNRVNAAAAIALAVRVKTQPDPYDLEEIELILADMAKRYDERIECYYGAAFFAGFRPEEEIVLRWAKIDRRARTGLVDVALHRGQEKATKNYETRLVEFNDRAWGYIERMRKWTELKAHGCVFENPRTKAPWASEADQRDLYFNPAVKRLGIRHRNAYKTRSSCAAMMLIAGLEPPYCAAQLGHSVAVFFAKYAKWINGKRNDEQRAKMNTAMKRAARKSAAA